MEREMKNDKHMEHERKNEKSMEREMKNGKSMERNRKNESEGMCWRLKRWRYGMRPAARAWEADYSEKLAEFGMAKGKSAPTVFYDEGRDLRCVVRGDDFTALGPSESLGWFRAIVQQWM